MQTQTQNPSSRSQILEKNSKQITVAQSHTTVNKDKMIFMTKVTCGIAVCIFDPKRSYGGITHLCFTPSESGNLDLAKDAAEKNIRKLLKWFKDQGSSPKDLLIKVIGTQQSSQQKEDFSTQATFTILENYGFHEFVSDIEENCMIEIQFHTASGAVYLKKTWDQKKPLSPQKTKSLEKTNPPSSITHDKIKVLIVDDSKVIRKLLTQVISDDPDLVVIGEAKDAFEAEKLRKTLKPDVMTLDIHMPKKDGVTYFRECIEKHQAIPTLIVTDYNLKNSGPVMDALQLGAFDYIKKPSLDELKDISLEICQKIKLAQKAGTKKIASKRKSSAQKNFFQEQAIDSSLIVIGASTGGTEALANLLSGLPKNIPPIVIVQHMPPAFTNSFAERLNQICPFYVKEAEESDVVQPGTVYIAPGGKQMKFKSARHPLTLTLTNDPPMNRFKPSVDYLFNSALTIQDKDIVAVLLTGMGSDGAQGLLRLKEKGCFTIAQDEASSVVYGMPKVAAEIGAAQVISALDDIPDILMGTK